MSKSKQLKSRASLGCALGAMAMMVGATAPLAPASAATAERVQLALADNPCAPKAKKKATNPCAAGGGAKAEAKADAKAETAKADAKPEAKDEAAKTAPK